MIHKRLELTMVNFASLCFFRFRFVRGDINSEEDMMAALKDVDVVFHSAALIEGSKEDMTKVNLGGTQNLLK